MIEVRSRRRCASRQAATTLEAISAELQMEGTLCGGSMVNSHGTVYESSCAI